MKVTLPQKPIAKKQRPKKIKVPEKNKVEEEVDEMPQVKAKRQLSAEHIQKMVEGRRKKLEEKKQEQNHTQDHMAFAD